MKPSQNNRRAALAKIHVAKKQLGLDDETYRDMLHQVAGVSSSAKLDGRGLDKVLAHMAAKGFKAKPTRRPRPAPGREKLVAKIRAMLITAERPDGYADAMAKRMFGIDRFEWCDADQLHRMVAALVYDAKRHGRPA